MLKAGIFLDIENLVLNGGWGFRFRGVRQLVESQGCTVLRANAYLAVDHEREGSDPAYRRSKSQYRNAARKEGFHLVLKAVRRYRDESGELVTKANADLDLAVDALLQSENLDYVLLGSGDGDFLRLVRALQTRGKRVDLLSFDNTNSELRLEVDRHFNGFLYPGLLPPDRDHPDRLRGTMHHVVEEKGFGFLTVQTGFGADEARDDVFLHINDFSAEPGTPVTNERFARVRETGAIVEFDLIRLEDGKVKAANAREFARGPRSVA